MKLSANLGFLWSDRSLPDAIHAAKRAGFDAVECHWPYDQPADAVLDALTQTGLPILGLNTVRGDADAGEFGLAAVRERQVEARRAIDQAFYYATKIGAQNVHVMAGKANGDKAADTFIENLRYACDIASNTGIGVLIEPINTFDVPGYFLNTPAQAVEIIERVALPELALMFDCYHVAQMGGDIVEEFQNCQPYVGHVQFARVPDRGAPIGGDLDFAQVFQTFAELGWDNPIGAEYRVDGSTEASLGWMSKLRGIS